MTIIDKEIFLNLPTEEIAELVRAAGPQVCVFPINGTRRWFMLEHSQDAKNHSIDTYMDITARKYIELYKLCFDHGIDTLLSPVFGSELFSRGDEYTKEIGVGGMVRLSSHPDFLSFYKESQVRVHFYGGYDQQLAQTPFDYVIDLFNRARQQTIANKKHRIFYGVFANDATDKIAELSVKYFQNTGKMPTSAELIPEYYGEYVNPVTMFIGFDKFSVFDYPLLNCGEENLYFTIAPSPYLNAKQLRMILYDHIYSRRSEEIDYTKMTKQDVLFMRNFYHTNGENTLGVGELRGGIWYPILQPSNP